jgi:CheY-like chemotaxis protein
MRYLSSMQSHPVEGGPSSAPSPTILLVEDDFDVRDALADTLRLEGYTVDCAGDGQEALEHLRRSATRPGLILLDLMMPRMSGSEFRAAQRADPELASIPVVVLSADSQMAEKATRLAAAGALRKPIDLDDLLDVVKKFV